MPQITTLEEAGLLYRKIEARLDKRKKEYEESIAKDQKALENLQVFMLSTMNANNIKQIDIAHVGRLKVTPKRTYGCGDWAIFGDFVVQHGVTDLFQKRIHEGNMDKFIETLPPGTLPPGINVFTKNIITITNPKGSS